MNLEKETDSFIEIINQRTFFARNIGKKLMASYSFIMEHIFLKIWKRDFKSPNSLLYSEEIEKKFHGVEIAQVRLVRLILPREIYCLVLLWSSKSKLKKHICRVIQNVKDWTHNLQIRPIKIWSVKHPQQSGKLQISEWRNSNWNKYFKRG